MRGGTATVDEDVAAGDEGPALGEHQLADGRDLVGGTGSAGRGELEHPPITGPVDAGGFVSRQRRDDDAGVDRVDARAPLAPAHGLGAEHRQVQQFVGRGGRQQAVLLGRQRGKPVAGLRGADHARAAGGDDAAELLEHERGAVQVDAQDLLDARLAGRDPGGVNDAGDLAEVRGGPSQRANGVAREDVDDGRVGVEARAGEDLGGGVGLAHVGEQDVRSRSDPATLPSMKSDQSRRIHCNICGLRT